ncbi:MAG: hypothetical protein HRT72_09140, partial [Flavobacteriales bacterium]|nr:hypothetical protein [Flavobacteriales bacterium]
NQEDVYLLMYEPSTMATSEMILGEVYIYNPAKGLTYYHTLIKGKREKAIKMQLKMFSEISKM